MVFNRKNEDTMTTKKKKKKMNDKDSRKLLPTTKIFFC
jgi:hypothetical protein